MVEASSGDRMASGPVQQSHDDRAQPRDQVFHRARATLAGGRLATVMVVNLSPGGMMARIEAAIAVGERLTVQLPVVGVVTATVRWSLGGRIGCQFERPIEPGDYGLLLAAAA